MGVWNPEWYVYINGYRLTHAVSDISGCTLKPRSMTGLPKLNVLIGIDA